MSEPTGTLFSAHPDSAGTTLELAISPAGHIHLQSVPAEAGLPEVSVAKRIRKRFEVAAPAGLLHLAAVELTSVLPPSLAFGRALAQLFMARWCALPDLVNQWATVELPAPRDELARLVSAAPPLTGIEYLDEAAQEALWDQMLSAAREEILALDGDLQAWLKSKRPSWNLVGRVCFHLAENKNDEHAPFAFLATYATRVSQQATVQHRPLSRALQEFASAGERSALLNLLLPVQRAAEKSPWLQTLVDSGAIFQPLAWSPSEAYRFLKDIPAFENSGVVVRIPDWWKPRQPPRPQLRVSVGNEGAGLGLDAMMDFQVELTLDGEVLSPEEWEQVLAAHDGLMRLKGHWVEVDREKLKAVLDHWKKAQRAAREGISFLQGMRLLAGADLDGGAAGTLPEDSGQWSRIVPGEWLKGVLEGLRGDEMGSHPGPALKAQLRPYQQAGVHWLWWLNRLGLGGCLADDMGLGKTVQVLGLLLLLKREGDPGPHLLVLPASLIANWQAEIARFAPSLRILVAHPSALAAKDLAALSGVHVHSVRKVTVSKSNKISTLSCG